MPISGAEQTNMANSLKQAVEEPVLKFKSEVIHHKSAAGGNSDNNNTAPSSEIIEGTITKDAIILEQELSNELRDLRSKGSEDNGQQMMQALGKSFDEVIKRDKNFG